MGLYKFIIILLLASTLFYLVRLLVLTIIWSDHINYFTNRKGNVQYPEFFWFIGYVIIFLIQFSFAVFLSDTLGWFDSLSTVEHVKGLFLDPVNNYTELSSQIINQSIQTDINLLDFENILRAVMILISIFISAIFSTIFYYVRNVKSTENDERRYNKIISSGIVLILTEIVLFYLLFNLIY